MKICEVEKQLEKLICETIDKAELQDRDYRADYQKYMDSIKFMILLSKIEKKFKIEITFEDLQVEKVGTFNSLSQTIFKYI